MNTKLEQKSFSVAVALLYSDRNESSSLSSYKKAK